MMRVWNIWRKRICLLLLCTAPLSLFVSAHLHAGAAPLQKSFLWKVRSNAGTVYLLGSVHAFKRELYPLPGKIENAFNECDTLVVEADVGELGMEKVITMLEGAIYHGSEMLEGHLSPGTYALARTRLAASGVPIELFQKTKPWLLALVISTLEMQKLGFDPEYGIDKHFLDKARDRKRIMELESVDYQAGLLSSLSDSDQDRFLLYTLRDLDILEKEMDTLLKAWTAGDTKTMESIVAKSAGEDPGISSVYEKLLGERNRNMTSRIDGFLSSGGKYFVVVGAGHLVGKRGIPELLKKKGYAVEQL
jgi:uncharacterized protein YbaP (TraB family)